MYDYGNARVAALRGRLVDAAAFRKLADADSAGAFLAGLDRLDDWHAVVRETEALLGQPQAAIEAAIERHRSARLGGLVGWYEGKARRLVEALVLALDGERLLASIRRRSGGLTAAEVVAAVVGGALLGRGHVRRASPAPRRCPRWSAVFRQPGSCRSARPIRW